MESKRKFKLKKTEKGVTLIAEYFNNNQREALNLYWKHPRWWSQCLTDTKTRGNTDFRGIEVIVNRQRARTLQGQL